MKFEALEMGEREALGDYMIRNEQRVKNHEASSISGGCGEVGNGIISRDKESCREWK